MKPLKELKENLHYLKAAVNGFQIRSLNRKNIDFDVFLPTLGKNLQRGYVWTLQQKRDLIWSIFFERNIPNLSFFIQEIDGEDFIQVIDGKQRLSTLLDFYNNKFHLEIENGLYYYNDLPKDYKSAIDCFHFNTYVIYDNLTDQQKVEWFNLINYSGTINS